jgi:phosphoglucosamine mutase
MLVNERGVLGGETSGHLLCLDRASTGDGIVIALQVLEVLRRRGADLRELMQGLHKVPQRTANLKIAPGSRPQDDVAVQAELKQAQAELQGRVRAFLRPSGTEPVLRVTVEADDPALVQTWLARLSDAVHAAA